MLGIVHPTRRIPYMSRYLGTYGREVPRPRISSCGLIRQSYLGVSDYPYGPLESAGDQLSSLHPSVSGNKRQGSAIVEICKIAGDWGTEILPRFQNTTSHNKPAPTLGRPEVAP